jgi:hypothetical protein
MHRTVAFLLVFLAGCSASPQITITGDASVTGRNIRYLKGGESPDYGGIEALAKTLGELPPPPPRIQVIPGTAGTAGTPPQTISPAVYNPLLQFIQAGPGGQQITLAHLQQITPIALSLVQYYLNNPGLTYQQIAYSSQGTAFLAMAQQILQPLGMWNYTTLNQWINYVQPQLGTIQSILLSLYNQLTVPLAPGTPGTPGTPDQYIVHAVNPLQVIDQIVTLFRSEKWLLFGEKAPGLVDLLIRHAGFSKTRLLLYGSRGRFYAPAAITSRREGNKRRAYAINQEGFFTNDQTSGAGLWYQGEDDISLVYMPISIEKGRVKTLDVIASDRYALLKRAAGGDLNLLDRASTFSTGLFQADVQLDNFHIRPFAGSTPFAGMGGLALEVEYSKGYLSGRIGAVASVEDGYFNDSESLVGFADMDNTLRTPALTIKNDDIVEPFFQVWGSTTLSLAGMATRALTTPRRAGERTWVRWGGQGDARSITQVHSKMDTGWTEFNLYAGLTVAAVPYGRVDLDKPHHTLRPYPIRWHIGGSVRFRVSRIYQEHLKDEHNSEIAKGVHEWWTEQEKRDYRDAHNLALPPEWVFVNLAGVGEFSRLFRKARVSLTLELADAAVGGMTEFEHYLDESFEDVRLGGLASWRGFYVQGLTSIRDEDYRLQFGFEFTL